MFILPILGFLSVDTNGQSIDTEFGKNRIQYHDDFNKWWMYETENFVTYWYGKGRNIGQASVQIAEYYHDEIQNLVEHRINDKIEIIVYTDISDLIQSNIGTEEVFETNAGETKVIGSKMFVYFNGDYQHLKSQLREGIAHVFINSMFVKTSLQEIITSNAELEIPEWFAKGFANYANSGWDNQVDDELREIWRRDKTKYHKFKKLLSDHTRLAGHSLWHYLYTSYGEKMVTTLVYLMRLSGDVDDSFKFILGKEFKIIQKDWESFYSKQYTAEEGHIKEYSDETLIDLGYKNFFPKSDFKLSPDGSYLAYAINNIGKYQLVIHDLKSGKKKKVLLKKGAKNAVQETDYNYPLMTWTGDRELSVVLEIRDRIHIRKYEVESGSFIDQDIPENIQRVYSIDYKDAETFIFSALIDGYSDLVEYNTKYRQVTKITDDYHNDLSATYVKLGSQRGILFASNRVTGDIKSERLDTTLPLNDFDIYFLPYTANGYSNTAVNLSAFSPTNDLQPLLANDHYITYLNDKSGILNRHIIDVNTNRSYANSNYEHNIINHEARPELDLYVFQVYHNKAYQLHITKPQWISNITSYLTSNNITLKMKSEEETAEVDQKLMPSQLFISNFPDPEKIESLGAKNVFSFGKQTESSIKGESEKSVLQFYASRAVASRRQFKLEKVETKIDNEVLFDGLESYTDNGREFDGQNPGILIKATTKDLFEDFEITGGVRIPTTFNGTEVFVTVDNKRNLIDRRFAIYRKTERNKIPFAVQPEQKEKFTSLLGMYRLSYPFSAYRSLRATVQLRIDNRFLLNSDFPSSSTPSNKEQRASLKFEYVFDNTLPIDINLRHGSRYKGYVELLNRFDLSLSDGFNFEFSRGFTTILGFDARHYEPILRNSVFAIRAAGATSFGNARMLYFVGDTDGSVLQRFNNDIPIPSNRNFAFMAHAPHLRGFDRNIRNGNSFFVVNSELRVPIVKYLSNREIKSPFLRNIQLVGFFDVGSAWYGILPGGSENPINSLTITNTPGIIIKVNVDRKPIVYGYGLGGRLSLLGYFIRVDHAWGNEGGSIQNPKWHFSLGQDF
ncbi:MAG: hypothetical protein V3V00_15295 [Saprospiraceae bacterium]